MAPKIWQGAETRWGNPTQKITWHFNPVVTWQFKNVDFLNDKLYGTQT